MAGESLRSPILLSVASTGGTGGGQDYQHGENQAAVGMWGEGILGVTSHLTSMAFGFLLYELVGVGSDELENFPVWWLVIRR